jgi:hypothetical protein
MQMTGKLARTVVRSAELRRKSPGLAMHNLPPSARHLRLDGGVGGFDDPSDLALAVTKIRQEVDKRGCLTISDEQLRILCPRDLSVSEQFARIAAIAQHEGWSFAFLPLGGVHFSTRRTR